MHYAINFINLKKSSNSTIQQYPNLPGGTFSWENVDLDQEMPLVSRETFSHTGRHDSI